MCADRDTRSQYQEPVGAKFNRPPDPQFVVAGNAAVELCSIFKLSTGLLDMHGVPSPLQIGSERELEFAERAATPGHPAPLQHRIPLKLV